MTNDFQLRFRQIHLDFHTSPEIPSVGEEFKAQEFAAMLKKAHVDSVTCFARCHHGMLYYDSKRFPERVHPGLKNKNMLKEMILACHEVGIRVPVYITIQWDQYTAEEHPEWIAIDEHGRQIGAEPYEPGFYRTLCVNTGYRDFLKEGIGELFEEMPVDGIFMDIVYPTDCSCSVCRRKMQEAGINLKNKKDRVIYAQEMIDEFKRDMSQYIRSFDEKVSIFYNTSHIGVRQRSVQGAYTHFELESLPSGDWGYIHFPVTMRYARTLDLDCVGHTGRFHQEWGDFHSFKNREALEYECFRMLALGCKCLIGDQLEPKGRLSQPMYDMIGEVYEKVEELEPWCCNAVPVTELAVLTPEEFEGGGRASLPKSLMGAENLLDKLSVQFDIIDTKADFTRYPLLILPDHIPVSESLHKRLKDYLARGGSMIVSYESGLDERQEYVTLPEMGIRLLPPSKDEQGELLRGRLSSGNEYIDYIVPEGYIGKGLPLTEHVMYSKGVEIEAEEGAEVLSWFYKPYFDRTYEHFCSHRQTPSSGKKGNPAVVKKGQVLYFASPIFTIYQDRAPKWCKTLMDNAISLLLKDRLVSHNGPSTVFTSLNRQEEKHREILHVLHYIPEKICDSIHTIEDVIPLYQLKIRWKTKGNKIRLIPQKTLISGKRDGEYMEFVIPKIDGYQVVESSWE